MVFLFENNFGWNYPKVYFKFRQRISNILLLPDIMLWRQYRIVLYLKLLARRYDISIISPASENTFQQQNCQENVYHKQNIFSQILRVPILDFSINHIWNIIEEYQIYCLWLILPYGKVLMIDFWYEIFLKINLLGTYGISKMRYF